MRELKRDWLRSWVVSSVREQVSSGIDWVPTIPAGWKVIPYKHVFKEIERPARDDDEVITCFRDGEVTLRKNRREDGFTIAEQESGYQHISRGDLVVHGMDGFAGSIGISDSDGKATPVLIVLNPLHDECPRYFMYQLRAYAHLEVFLATSTGIRVRSCSLNWKKLGSLPAIVPPSDEQQRIADYLDERCEAIDEAKKSIEDEIEALQRLRKATIFKAVTKGLDDDAPMRSSGVEWIGDIPAGWQVKPIWTVLKQRKETNKLGKAQLILSVMKDVGVIPYSEKGNVGNKAKADITGYMIARKNDIVFNSMNVIIGSVGLSNYDGAISPAYYAVYSRDPSFDIHYCSYIFQTRSFQRALRRIANGILEIRLKVNFNKFAHQQFPIPPFKEQQLIVARLDDRCAVIDSIVNARKKQLERLEDYRKALIYAYATGKKEVPAS